METISKYTVSFGASLAITSILSALLVVLKELNENSVLAWMKGLTSHHWITHGLFMVIAFFAIGWGLAKMNNGEGLKMTPEPSRLCDRERRCDRRTHHLGVLSGRLRDIRKRMLSGY